MRKLILLILVLGVFEVSAQILPNYGGQRAGLSTLSFLKNDVSPRSMAMSGASVALNFDGYNLFSNPAAITGADALAVSASNFVVGAGVQQSFLSGVLPIQKSHFGLSYILRTVSQVSQPSAFFPQLYNGLMSRRRCTVAGNTSRTLSISASVVSTPRLKRVLE